MWSREFNPPSHIGITGIARDGADGTKTVPRRTFGGVGLGEVGEVERGGGHSRQGLYPPGIVGIRTARTRTVGLLLFVGWLTFQRHT